MKTYRVFVWLMTSILMLGMMAPLSADDETGQGEQLPGCTDEEAIQLFDIFWGEGQLAGEFQLLLENLQILETSEELNRALQDAVALHAHWGAQNRPSFPDCAQAAEASTLYGQLLDETLISVSLLQTAHQLASNVPLSPEDEALLTDIFTTADLYAQQVLALFDELRTVVPEPVSADGEAFFSCLENFQDAVACFHHLFEP